MTIENFAVMNIVPYISALGIFISSVLLADNFADPCGGPTGENSWALRNFVLGGGIAEYLRIERKSG